jgi:cytochrome c oxidase subunit IV
MHEVTTVTTHSNDTTSAQHAHPRPNYLLVFVGLALLTAIEVGITYLGIPQAILTASLLGFMVFKVILVALFYMHLRVDSKWFAYVFLIPLPFVVLILSALYFTYPR